MHSITDIYICDSILPDNRIRSLWCVIIRWPVHSNILFNTSTENFLWPNFKEDSCTLAHVMSIVVIVNEKFRNTIHTLINPLFG